jgi:hypothetical protein
MYMSDITPTGSSASSIESHGASIGGEVPNVDSPLEPNVGERNPDAHRGA